MDWCTKSATASRSTVNGTVRHGDIDMSPWMSEMDTSLVDTEKFSVEICRYWVYITEITCLHLS